MKKYLAITALTILCATLSQAVVVHWWADSDQLDGASSIQLIYSAGSALTFDNSAVLQNGSVLESYPSFSVNDGGFGDDFLDPTANNATRGSGYYHVVLFNADKSQYKTSYFDYNDGDFVQVLTGDVMVDSINSGNFFATIPAFTSWAAVPEPSSTALLLLATATLALRRRFR